MHSPAQIDLFASAVRAVAQLDEDPEDNPIAAAVSNEKAAMIEKGIDWRTLSYWQVLEFLDQNQCLWCRFASINR